MITTIIIINCIIISAGQILHYNLLAKREKKEWIKLDSQLICQFPCYKHCPYGWFQANRRWEAMYTTEPSVHSLDLVWAASRTPLMVINIIYIIKGNGREAGSSCGLETTIRTCGKESYQDFVWHLPSDICFAQADQSYLN